VTTKGETAMAKKDKPTGKNEEVKKEEIVTKIKTGVE